MIQFAVSSWSLDGTLNVDTPLLDLPGQLKANAIPLLELCHFHLPETSPKYLERFRQSLEATQVKLYSLLIDLGDIATPDDIQRHQDLQSIRHWIDVAAMLGAEQVRIVAGNQPSTPEVIQRSKAHMLSLANYAGSKGVHTSTENWQKTSEDTQGLLDIVDASGVRLIADIGNAEGPNKYQTLARLLSKANSIHFKVRQLEDGSPDTEDLSKVLNLIKENRFTGVITLIYDKKHEEWKHIRQLASLLQPLVAN